MIRTKILLFLLLAAFLHGCSTDNHDWLYGKWGLEHDPDGSSKDYLEFRKDGVFISTIPGRGSVKGIYEIHDGYITLNVEHGLTITSIRMNMSHNNTRLTNKSGAWYTKKAGSE